MTKTTVINVITLLGIAVVGAACGPDQRIIESGKKANESRDAVIANANVNTAASTFEQDLNAMRTADFKFIVVFRRKDGQPLDAADKALISKTAAQANRRSLADEGKAVIIGSNFPFPEGEFKPLNERFTMDNHSKSDSGPMFVNGNVNMNANIKR